MAKAGTMFTSWHAYRMEYLGNGMFNIIILNR